ncbi:MAG: hypothetical protein IIY62_02735 [Kiritimatiellae bacterium]|nr:hypothetical protein [Kiritimatiellia bacterium]
MKAGNTRGNAGAFGAAAFAAALAAAGIARAGADGRVAQDTPERALTVEEIIAAPRPKTTRTPLPEDARIYIGSGVYANRGIMKMGGFCFTYWEPEKLDYDELIDLCVKEGVGNTLQFWQNNENLRDLALKAKARGLYSTCIYSSATNGLAREIVSSLGGSWIGYDFGERFTFSLYTDWKDRGVSLRALAGEYMNRVHKHVGDLHAAGWGNVMATSSNFSLDYEVAAGAEIPCTEDFPFGDLTLASALSRGLYRQYGLPMWGSHLAHEWYSWIPHRNPWKMKTLETAFRLKYMTGAKVIVNESGNWQLQSSLCEDSPMSQLPVTCRRLSTPWDAAAREKYEKPALAEAKKRFSWIDYRSPVAVKYRRAISDFTAFCREHPAPRGQPEATWAIAKGNLDLGGPGYIPGNAVCGAYDLARRNPNWMYGLPEMSWDVVRRAVMPMPPMLAPNKNIHFSASPYGLCDVVSFACDNVTAEHLLKNYKVLMFAGWNTCSPKQYRILCDYVKGGGKLVIGLAHLSTDDARGYTDPSPAKLVNGGDLSELCGFRVVGETPRKYWATGPSTERNCLGFVARRRFGYMCLPLGRLEYTAPAENFEELAVDDEDGEPFILRCRNGRGEVFFMNWWAYPAAANMDVGCGSEVADVGMVGYLYRYCAKLGRGNVWITGRDFENPDEDCGWILYSYFPDEGKVYLLNLDYAKARSCVLQQFGDKDFLTLEPGEFRIVDSVRLDPDEKLNAE